MCEIDDSSCHCAGIGVVQALILRIIDENPEHGYSLMQKAKDLTKGAYSPESGTIYTILRRLEKKGLLTSIWERTDSHPAKRIYSISDRGKAMLEQVVRMMKKNRKIIDAIITYIDSKNSDTVKNE
nr:PadR family transcriptional regulator [Candidatus Sigynarchaeota archaeon]